jgi:hypothetical protein
MGLVSVRKYAGQQQIPAFFTKPNPARLTFSLITILQMLVYIYYNSDIHQIVASDGILEQSMGAREGPSRKKVVLPAHRVT